MANNRHVDYVNTYFPHPEPTKIKGKPNYKSLTTVFNKIKANASGVDCNLRGGNHGYLGLVLSDVEYANISGTVLFIAPEFPAPLTVPATATQVQAFNLKTQHDEAIRK